MTLNPYQFAHNAPPAFRDPTGATSLGEQLVVMAVNSILVTLVTTAITKAIAYSGLPGILARRFNEGLQFSPAGLDFKIAIDLKKLFETVAGRWIGRHPAVKAALQLAAVDLGFNFPIRIGEAWSAMFSPGMEVFIGIAAARKGATQRASIINTLLKLFEVKVAFGKWENYLAPNRNDPRYNLSFVVEASLGRALRQMVGRFETTAVTWQNGIITTVGTYLGAGGKVKGEWAFLPSKGKFACGLNKGMKLAVGPHAFVQQVDAVPVPFFQVVGGMIELLPGIAPGTTNTEWSGKTGSFKMGLQFTWVWAHKAFHVGDVANAVLDPIFGPLGDVVESVRDWLQARL